MRFAGQNDSVWHMHRFKFIDPDGNLYETADPDEREVFPAIIALARFEAPAQ